MVCKKCRKELADEWKACPYCGAKIASQKKPSVHHGNGQGGAYKRGSLWTARVTVGWLYDKPIRKTKSGFSTKAEALAYCAKLLETPNRPKHDETFQQVYLRWLESYERRVAESTLACYKAAWNWFAPVQHLKLVDLTVAELQGCVDACPRGRSTLDDMRTVCSLVFKYAIDNKFPILHNPGSSLYTGEKKKGTRRAFTWAELEKIRSAVGVYPYADYVYCMCYLGYRPNEMLSLRKSQYDAEHKCFIAGIKSEAGIDRIMTISPKIMPLIAARLLQGGELIFPGPDGKQMNDETFRTECFYPLMDNLGIEGAVPYSCRHTFANLLKRVQGSDTDKAALIGHSDASMTKYYQSADYESLKAITDCI